MGFLLYLTLVWPSTGQMLSWLHLSPPLAGLLLISYLLWKFASLMPKIRALTMKNVSLRWSLWPRRENAARPQTEGTTNKGRAIVYTTLMVAATFGLAFAITRTPKYPVETHHNVTVWSQVKGTKETWWISSDEPEPNKLPLMRWNCCPDFPCDTVMGTMIVASTVKYEDQGTCKSIRASGLGWTWEKEIP